MFKSCIGLKHPLSSLRTSRHKTKASRTLSSTPWLATRLKYSRHFNKAKWYKGKAVPSITLVRFYHKWCRLKVTDHKTTDQSYSHRQVMDLLELLILVKSIYNNNSTQCNSRGIPRCITTYTRDSQILIMTLIKSYKTTIWTWSCKRPNNMACRSKYQATRWSSFSDTMTTI